VKIAIIGAGHIGTTLAAHLAGAGHHVAIANSREPQTLADTVAGINGRFTTSRVDAMRADDAAEFGDVVVLAIPFRAYRSMPVRALDGKLVVDATNYIPDRDGHITELDNGHRTSSELVQEYLTGSTVVKAFNTMRWDHLRDYGLEGGTLYRFGIPVASDDGEAKYLVLNLVNDIGFDPVDAGDLADGRTFEPGSGLYGTDLRSNAMEERIAAAT
jgi:8-hydroxy-5-deazaflavin:NADPH oxidoreductase